MTETIPPVKPENSTEDEIEVPGTLMPPDEEAALEREMMQALDAVNYATLDTLAALDRLNRQQEQNVLELRTARQILAESNQNAQSRNVGEPLFK